MSVAGQNPAGVVQSLMVSRGYRSAQHRTAEARYYRQQQAQQRAAERKAEEAEAAWRRNVAIRAAAIPGVDMRDAVAQVLPNWDDRQR